MSTDSAIAGRNRLLVGLPPAVRSRLQARMEHVEVAAGMTVSDAATPLTHAYFPETGIVSLVVALADGATIQAAMVGSEGVAPLPHLLGNAVSSIRVVWQSSGSAWRLGVEDFISEMARSRAFRERILRYGEALYVQMAQSIACGRHHLIEARCVRWLLCCSDRAGDEFGVTQESLAHMLGVRRPGVSVATADLARAGLIRYRRGRMFLLDRRGLEALACECYAVVHAEFARLVGW